MPLHTPHPPAPSRPLVSIVLAFAALFIPGCDALEPFLRARTLDCKVTHSIESTSDGPQCALAGGPRSPTAEGLRCDLPRYR